MRKQGDKSPPSTVVRLDFSGKDRIRAREAAGKEADRQLRADPEFRAIQSRIADSEENAAKESEASGCLFLLGAVGIAGAAVGIDLAVGELFNMQQVLQGEDVTAWSQRITHGIILGVGGVAAFVSGVIGIDHGFDAEEQRVSADCRRNGRLY